MVKLIVTVVLLAIVACVVFFFGWIQIKLPENTYAVIFTKTGGWDETVTEAGTFVWRWERLIPTNMTIHEYILKPHTSRVSLSGKLPSAETYAAAFEPRPDFSYDLTFSISFTVEPSALPRLAADDHTLPEDLSAWMESTGKAIAERVAANMQDVTAAADVPELAATLASYLESEVRERVQSSFRDVDITSVTLTKMRLPDMQLYAFAQEQFQRTATVRFEAERALLAARVAEEHKANQWFEVLERYGEVLSEYPALLDLFALEPEKLGSLLSEETGAVPLGAE